MTTFNPRELNFINQMVSYYGKKTATQCAIDSGFSPNGARTRASELMARNDIRNEIEKQLEEIRSKWLITKDKHYQELGELRDMAKDTKNVNAAVRAEELRGKVAGLYIDRQIMATASMRRLPDGTLKAEQDMTAEDYELIMRKMLTDHNIEPKQVMGEITSKVSKKKTKRPR